MQRRPATVAAVLAGAVLALGAGACGSSGTGRRTSTSASAPTATAARYQVPPAGIAAVQLFEPMQRYTAFAETKLTTLHSQLAALRGAIASGSLVAARSAWLTAHETWLEIGQDDGQYGAFGTLGGDIDGLADGDVGGAASAQFTGFHKVELDLYRRDSLDDAATDGAELSRLVDQLTPRTVGQDLALTDTSLDAWVLRAHEILEDALRDSLSQDDNYGSNSDLDSIRADVSATEEMLEVLSGLVAPRAPGLVSTARAQLRAIDTDLSADPTGLEPSGLSLRARQRLDGDVGAALETLAPISELMQISNANS